MTMTSEVWMLKWLKQTHGEQYTGVCKINGVFVVVFCWKTDGITTINNNNNTVYFANTGMCVVDCEFSLVLRRLLLLPLPRHPHRMFSLSLACCHWQHHCHLQNNPQPRMATVMTIAKHKQLSAWNECAADRSERVTTTTRENANNYCI